MTTFNGERFISESLDSVFSQSFRDFELVVVDDCSTDGTAAILASYADPRMRVIRNSVNLGVVGARNRGFAELRGLYVATLDHDDIWLPTRLEAGVAQLDQDPSTVMVATHNLVLADGRYVSIDRPAVVSPMLFRWMLLMECPVVYSSLLFRREVAKISDGMLLHPELRYADDYQLMLRLASLGRIVALDAALTIYRVHSGNTTNQVHREMYLHAVEALSDRLTDWLGADAFEAARLIAWHISRRNPAPDGATLRRLGALLRRLIASFVSAYRPTAEDRRDIEEYTKQAYWRTLRASIRGGRIWLLGTHWNRSVPAVHGLGSPRDVIESLAVGILRFPGRFLLSKHEIPLADS